MNVSYEHRTLFRYEGPLDMQLLPQIVKSAEQLLIGEKVRTPLRRKIISILIELAQNVIHYGIHNHPLANPTISLTREGDNIVLSISNPIHVSQELFLRTYIENLLSMSKDEQNALYQNVLTKSDYTDSGGAGLGILQVLIKSDSFSYKIEPLGQEHAYFYDYGDLPYQ
jgi:two-component sensor histidine kinase